MKRERETITNIEERKGYRKTQSTRKLNAKSKRAKMTLDRLHESKITTLADKNSELKEDLSKAGDVVTSLMANAKVQQELSNVNTKLVDELKIMKKQLKSMQSMMLFQGECHLILQEMKRLHIRAVFKEWKVLKAYDCSSIGAFKTSTVKALHFVLDEEKQEYFPSPSGIDRARKLLDDYAMQKIGCERRATKYGEVYYMDFDRTIRLLLKATGLYEKVQKTSVSLSFTADGALLMKTRTHVSCGVKVTDVDGKHPIAGLRLMSSCEDDDYDEESTIKCMQSRELCAILVMADAKDSKELYYDVFSEFYEYSEKLRQFCMPARDGEPALQPFIVSHPQDMKSAQTVARRGGCCKTKAYFCHLCSCTKHQLTSYNIGNQ